LCHYDTKGGDARRHRAVGMPTRCAQDCRSHVFRKSVAMRAAAMRCVDRCGREPASPDFTRAVASRGNVIVRAANGIHRDENPAVGMQLPIDYSFSLCSN